MANAGDSRASGFLAVAVFLVSVTVIAFELALTRCFSVLLRYHFVFLIVSVATFGLGAGGLVDYVLLRRKMGQTHFPTSENVSVPFSGLAWLATLLAPLPAVSVLLLFRSPIARHLTNLWAVALSATPPFLVAGIFLSCVLRSFARQGGRLYGADLMGAATGSLAIIAGLQLFGGTGAAIAAGILAGLAAVGLSWEAGGALRRGVAVAAALAPAVLLSINLATGIIDLPAVPTTSKRVVKTLYQELGDPKQGARIVYSDWNAFARTDVVQYHPPDEPRPWPQLYVYTDGDVPTNMWPFRGKMEEVLPKLERFIGFLPFRVQRPKRVLLIGPGGGLDVLLAFAVGSERIDGVELNPSIPKIMRRFARLNGRLYEYRNVNVRVDEGRSFLRRTGRQYDMVYMALSYAATTAGSGSLALVESYLHTVEAFRDCLDRVSRDGQVVFVCAEAPLLLRAYLTALAALQQEGVSRQEALRCLVVVDVPPEQYQFGPYRHMLLIRKTPFGPEQSRALAQTALAMGLFPGCFPEVYVPEPFSVLFAQDGSDAAFEARVREMIGADSKMTILPVTDDRPFVTDLTRGLPAGFDRFLVWGAGVLLCLLAVTCAVHHFTGRRAGGPAGAAEEYHFASRSPSEEKRLPLGWVVEKGLYFAAVGIGFMLIEVCLAQRLILYLGYPTLSLAVILFALLLGGGLGSLRSQRWSVQQLAGRGALAAVIAAAIVLTSGRWLGILFNLSLQWPVLARTIIAITALTPLGLVMGVPFPTGIRRLGNGGTGLVPWMWALNGTASVLGSVGAMCAAKLWGFHTVLALGGLLYVVAGTLSAMEHFGLRRPPLEAGEEGAALADRAAY